MVNPGPILPRHATDLVAALAGWLGALALDREFTTRAEVDEQARCLWLFLPGWVREHALLPELQAATWAFLLDHWGDDTPC